MAGNGSLRGGAADAGAAAEDGGAIFAAGLSDLALASLSCAANSRFATTGCFVSHTTKEREVPTASDATSGAGRRCGNEICTPDRRCVEGHSGYFHCE